MRRRGRGLDRQAPNLYHASAFFGASILGGLFSKLNQKLRGRRPQKDPKPAVNDILMARAAESSADFIEGHLATTLLIRRSDQIRDYAIKRAPAEGLLLELGVYKGRSINQFATILNQRSDPRKIYGFDAFEGLSEDWFGKSIARQANFNRSGRAPKVLPNVELIIGWLDDTLKPFLDRHPGQIAMLHIDTDTYTPCKLALTLCRGRFADGAIVIFDEHHGYPNWQNGEFKALNEVFRPEEYSYLAFATQQAVIRIERALDR